MLLYLDRPTCEGPNLQGLSGDHVAEAERIPVIAHGGAVRGTLTGQRQVGCNLATWQQGAEKITERLSLLCIKILCDRSIKLHKGRTYNFLLVLGALLVNKHHCRFEHWGRMTERKR